MKKKGSTKLRYYFKQDASNSIIVYDRYDDIKMCELITDYDITKEDEYKAQKIVDALNAYDGF